MFKSSKSLNVLAALMLVTQVGIAQMVQPAKKLLKSGSKPLTEMADTLGNKMHMVTNIGAMKHTGGNGTYFVNAELKNLKTLNIAGKKRASLGFSMGDVSLETMPKDTFDTKFAVGPIVEIPVLKSGNVTLTEGNNVPRITVNAFAKVIKTLGQGPGSTTAYQAGLPVTFNTTLSGKSKMPTGGANPPRKAKLIYGEITPTYANQSYFVKTSVDGKVVDKIKNTSGLGVRAELGAQVNKAKVFMQAGTSKAKPVPTIIAKGPYACLGTRVAF